MVLHGFHPHPVPFLVSQPTSVANKLNVAFNEKFATIS